jgi:type VI secretion system protein ImpM
MACGLFGKLPSKRDFVAVHAPRRFLASWEAWLHAGIATSRELLGSDWQQAFLEAPIWRFWLGQDIVGAETAGAIMPSVDGVGRYFPLTVFACAPEGMTLDPPTVDSEDGWFEAVEAEMLSALELNSTDPAEFAQRLPEPAFRARAQRPTPPLRPADDTAVWLAPGDAVAAVLADLRQRDRDAVHGTRAYFWTIGGANYRSQLMMSSGLPAPILFSGFLTGRFETRQTA